MLSKPGAAAMLTNAPPALSPALTFALAPQTTAQLPVLREVGWGLFPRCPEVQP